MKHRFLFVAPLLLSGCPAPGANSMTEPVILPVSAPASPGKSFDYQTAAARAKDAAPMVAAQNDFGARLVSQLQGKNDPTKNLLISPTSLWQALALAESGGKGETKTQMQTLLGMQTLPDGKVGAANRAFNALLAEQKGASISVANSLWFTDKFRPNPTFVKDAASNFGAGVETFPEGDPAQGAARINEWVSAHTQKEIPKIVNEGDVTGMSALLVNAVYFRGGWRDPFDKSQTKPAPFHLEGGASIQVPTMHAEREHAYLSGESFEGASLPYDNTGCALWVLLPKTGKKADDVFKELGGDKAAKFYGRGSVVMSLPRFEIEWKDNLKTELAGMNAPLPFDPKADFSAMGEPVGAIAEVIHVCKMRVDEEGTVAAAATVTGMAGAAAPMPEEPKVLKFDRPFVVALVEGTSGARLFEGVVNNPSTNNPSAPK